MEMLKKNNDQGGNIMNGLELLTGMAIVGSVAFVMGKFAILKQEKQFWKDSCYTVMEMYNNMLVKQSMNSALETIQEKRDHIN
jgi:uncharacterized membrane protein required for colicin V production